MSTNRTGDDLFPWSQGLTPIEPLFALVSSVTALSVGFTEGETPSAVISAAGTVPTGGWSFGILSPKLSTAERRQSEIWDLLFLGRLPQKDTYLLQVVTRIEAVLVTQLPPWAKAIRVIASDGEKVVSLPEASASRIKAVSWGSHATNGGADGFPW